MSKQNLKAQLVDVSRTGHMIPSSPAVYQILA